ncbi:MAG: sigma-70 family RNA polymerase sigma factor [Lachnospiraceae bacterium]|nr:sigma-70 family RNA polymerase sigma factor [Lachnospiraceae bacterium]
MTDKELEQIYNEAYKAVYWTAMSLLKNEADAEDIVQDTFVTLIESYDSIKDKSKVTSWLKKTAANKCLDRIKLTKTDNMDDEFFESVEAVPEDFLPDSIVENEDARKIVMDIINNSLSDDIRRTLILFYFDDMSIKEIAVALGVPEGTVSRRLNFARNKIKKEVEKYEKDNDTKLYGMAIPFLSQLFIKEAEQVAFKPLPASLANLSASAEASKAGANLAKTAVKKGTDVMKTKIIIGASVALVAVIATVAVVFTVVKPPEVKPETVGTEEAGSSNSQNTSDALLESSSGSETETSAANNYYGPINISLEGMSPDEIVANVNSIRTIKYDAQMKDYPGRFSIENTFDHGHEKEDMAHFWYVWDTDLYKLGDPKKAPPTFMNLSAYVDWIQFSLYKDGDGTYLIDKTSDVEIKMVFTDREQAIAVYERFVEETEKFGEIKRDIREGNLEKPFESSWVKESENDAYQTYAVWIERSALTYDRSTKTLVEAYEVWVSVPIIKG